MEHNHTNSEARAKAPKILLTDTTRSPFSARLAIGFAKGGCDVAAICPTTCHPLAMTGAVQELFPYSALHPLVSLSSAIQVVAPTVIVPCDDRSVLHLHELYAWSRNLGASGDNIANLIEFSLGSPESHPIVTSRYELLKIAGDEGIRVPDMRLLNVADDFDHWKEGQKFPWVLKADGTFGGRGVRVADSLEQAEQYLLELSRTYTIKRALKRWIVNRDPFWLRPCWNRSKPAVIVQSYIHGRPANCAVVCWHGRLLAGIAVEVVSAQGMRGPATVVRVVDNSEMIHAAEKIAHKLGLSGFFGLDFMIEDGSGTAYLIEMNPRCTPLCHLQLGKGRDMVEALLAQISGRPLQETPSVTQNNLIAYFPQAWHSKSELLKSSFQDIPQGEPDLVEDLLRPWPDRSLLFRIGLKVGDFVTAVGERKSLLRRTLERS